MNVWYEWVGISFITNLALIGILPILRYAKYINLKNKWYLVCLAVLCILLEGITPGNIKNIWGVIVLLCIREEYYTDILKRITMYFAILLAPSLMIHILLMYIPIPPWGGIIDLGEFYSKALNYYIYVKSTIHYSDRFTAVFNEPGHLGMILAYLLYANKYDLKRKSVLVCFLSLLFTLSLAAYVLLFIGIFVYLIIHKRKAIKKFIGVVILLFVSYMIVINHNGGDNIINEKIVHRLEIDRERGIAGNNRVSQDTDEYFANVSFVDIFLGKHDIVYLERKGVQGAGYKIYLLRYGLITLFFVFLLYLCIARYEINNRLYSYGFLFIIAISFWQRSYPLMTAQLAIYIIACMRKYPTQRLIKLMV